MPEASELRCPDRLIISLLFSPPSFLVFTTTTKMQHWPFPHQEPPSQLRGRLAHAAGVLVTPTGAIGSRSMYVSSGTVALTSAQASPRRSERVQWELEGRRAAGSRAVREPGMPGGGRAQVLSKAPGQLEGGFT